MRARKWLRKYLIFLPCRNRPKGVDNFVDKLPAAVSEQAQVTLRSSVKAGDAGRIGNKINELTEIFVLRKPIYSGKPHEIRRVATL